MAETNSVALEIDVDRITVEQFLILMEIQERMGEKPAVADIRAMLDILQNAIVNHDEPLKLPYRYLSQIMGQVMAAFTAGIDVPN